MILHVKNLYPPQITLFSSSIQKFLHFFGADKEAVLNMTNFRWSSFAQVPDLKLNSSWMEFWAQVTWDCSFQTSGPQGQPHVNAGLRSVRQLSAIWLQTKRNCLVSRSARWSYICQVGFYCLNSFWRFKLLIFRILEMFLLWMILYNYIIPLSMYVCLEMCTKNYSKIQKVQNV